MRFHSTLKHMMQKRGEASKEWDDFLPYVCFAYRDSVHAATGYTPFQLLFGRDVRGPLSLLKSQLTGETKGSQPVVEFLEKMKSRLQHAWEKASENNEQAKLKSKNYHDKKSCHRQFQPGDQVLVFEPGEDKFEAQWQGPYTVESRINNLVYHFVAPERRKKLRQYHVNSMKEKTPPAVMAVTYCREETDEVLGDGPELYPFERGCKESPTLNTQLSTAQQVQAKALLEEFEDVFSNEPGNTQLATHSINTGDAKPVYNQPCRVPQAWQAKIREEIHTMLEAEVIEPSTSPWTSPIVPVHKKDGSLRLCIDYRQLNAVTQDDRYQMPRVDEMVERLGKAQFITTLDLAKGYYQVLLKTEDQEKTAFTTPRGSFNFDRCPLDSKGRRQHSRD